MVSENIFGEPHPWEPFFVDTDAHLSHTHWATMRSVLMRQVLIDARSGRLRQGWRNTLSLPEPLAQTSEQRYLDGENLALSEVRELPVALWEPGAASSWREALDSWFQAMRDLLWQASTLRSEMDQVTRQLRHQSLRSALGDRWGGRNDYGLIDQMISTDPIFDDGAVAVIANSVVDRDRMTAWYLAGRAAGGDDVAWVEWFHERIAKWRNPTAAEWEIASMSQPKYRDELQKLPRYWTDLG